jgi:DNA-binding MarR family transcriptional regulator
MALAARIHRASALLLRRASAAVQRAGLKLGEFDVLSALRRSGAPFSLTPSELAERVMMSPGGLTNRLDRLEAAGLVRRTVASSDRRSRDVALTAKGRRTVDRAVDHHVESLRGAFEAIGERGSTRLERLLARLALPARSTSH